MYLSIEIDYFNTTSDTFKVIAVIAETDSNMSQNVEVNRRFTHKNCATLTALIFSPFTIEDINY